MGHAGGQLAQGGQLFGAHDGSRRGLLVGHIPQQGDNLLLVVDVRHRRVGFFKASAVERLELGLLNPAASDRRFHQARLTGSLLAVDGRVTGFALTIPEVLIKNVVLIFHHAIVADDADPLVEVGKDSLQLVALGFDDIPGLFQLGDVTKRLNDADNVTLGAQKRRGGENTGDAFSVRALFIHITLDRFHAVAYSVDGAILRKTGRPGKNLVAFFADGIRLLDVGQALEGLVDFQNVEVAVHQPHGHRGGLKDLV